MNRISSLIHFLPQVHNSLRNNDAITSLCQINKEEAIYNQLSIAKKKKEKKEKTLKMALAKKKKKKKKHVKMAIYSQLSLAKKR